jgi:transposase
MGGVAKGYVRSRRDELMLLPVDVREWLPVDHVVWFLLDVVKALDTSALHARAKLGGAGRAPYDPDMLLALLVYAYSGALRSSRKIERRCREDVSFMVLTGLNYPDHVTICRFRKDNDDVMGDLFDQVLVLCHRAGLGKLDHVSIDGTKIAADASTSRSRDVDGLRGTGRRWLDEAARVDDEEDARFGEQRRGDELPEELRDPIQRRKIIDELIEQAKADPDRKRGRARAGKARRGGQALDLADQAVADAEAKAGPGVEQLKAEAQQAEQTLAEARATVQAQHEAYQQRAAEAAARGRRPIGRAPGPVEQNNLVTRAQGVLKARLARLQKRQAQLPKLIGKRNLTDPDARFMPVRGGGFVLGYNAQLVVSADHLILACKLVQDPGDQQQLQPMFAELDRVVNLLRQATNNPNLSVGTALLDAGYASIANLEAPGPDRLIALGNRNNITGDTPATSPPHDDSSAWYKMAWRLSTPAAQKLYKKRGATVEPVNGHLKQPRGLRRFSRRRLPAAKAELALAALTTNLMRLFTSRKPLPTSPH